MTLEEIQAATAANPQLKTGLLSSLKDDFLKAPPEGVVIRTAEQDQQHLQSHLDSVLPGKVEEQFTAKFKQNLDAMDAVVAELTGETKGPHEKTTDFIKRSLTSLKTKSSNDPVTAQKVAELENMLSSTKADYDQKISQKEQELFDREVKWGLTAELDRLNIAVPMHLKTDAEKQAYVNEQKQLIQQGFMSKFKAKKDAEGKTVFFDGDKPLMSSTNGAPKTQGDILAERYAAYFVPGGKEGKGTGYEGAAGGTGAITDMASIHAVLKSRGLDPETNEAAYMQQFQKLATENGVAL